MNMLAERDQKLSEIEKLKNEVREIEESEEYKTLAKFKSQLEKLMDDYSKSAKDVLKVLQFEEQPVEKAPRKERALLTYKNPHTGEVVKTKGGNHKVLKAWRNEYGSEAVNSWKS